MATIKSIKEKAKAYDEAIKRVEDIVGGKCPKPFVFTEGLFDYIFPELKESEKIRNTIFDCLYKCCDSGVITREQRHICIAWLEKKGEPNPYSGVSFKYNGHTWGMCARDNGVEILVDGEIKERVFSDNTYQGKSALEAINEEKVDNANKVEPRQEKLTEFEKAVKQVMEEAIECGDTRNLKADAEMLLSLVHNSSWSEEDEKLLDKVIKRLHKYSAEDEEYLDKYYWLIELKHRVQPQNTWKPSDEQIKVLVEVLVFAANHESPHWQDYIFGVLKNLTRQLKKLREE